MRGWVPCSVVDAAWWSIVWGVCPTKECVAQLGPLLVTPLLLFCIHNIKLVYAVYMCVFSLHREPQVELAALYACVP